MNSLRKILKEQGLSQSRARKKRKTDAVVAAVAVVVGSRIGVKTGKREREEDDKDNVPRKVSRGDDPPIDRDTADDEKKVADFKRRADDVQHDANKLSGAQAGVVKPVFIMPPSSGAMAKMKRADKTASSMMKKDVVAAGAENTPVVIVQDDSGSSPTAPTAGVLVQKGVCYIEKQL